MNKNRVYCCSYTHRDLIKPKIMFCNNVRKYNKGR